MITAIILFTFYALIMITLITTYFCYPIISKYLIKSNIPDKVRSKIGSEYVIIPAYNEESVVEEKILNTLQHLEDNGKVIVVSDASEDYTDQICSNLQQKYGKIEFYVNHDRGGKNTCLNLAVEKINPEKDDVLIFTDCNTFFDDQSLPEIRKSLMNGASLAAGSMVYESMKTDSAKSEGMYWRYEEWIRRNESKKGRLIVCNGGLFGMWGDCYEMLPPFVPNDFEGPLRLTGKGKRTVINPNAIGLESAINSPEEEYSRKKRMANRQMNCIIYLWDNLSTGTKIQVLFHKLFRWFGVHLFTLATLLVIVMFVFSSSVFIQILTWFHFIVFSLILLSWINEQVKMDKKVLPKILHAVKVHLTGARGALEAIKGSKTAIWEKASTNR